MTDAGMANGLLFIVSAGAQITVAVALYLA
jgi:hypothetical protein